MASYKLSRRASEDLDTIYEYGIFTFGHQQARNYILELEKNLQLIAKSPKIGKKFSSHKRQLLQFNFKSHTVFYMIDDNFIRIIRILGARMDFDRHL